MVDFRTALYPAAVVFFMAAVWIKITGGTGSEEAEYSRYFNRAQINESKEAYITAADYYAKAAEIRPEEGETLLLAAENYMKCGEYGKFAEYCLLAEDAEDTGDRPWLMLGEYYMNNGKVPEAARVLENVPEERCTQEILDMLAAAESSFHTGYRNFDDAKPFYGEYCAVRSDGLWGLADEEGGFCIRPVYEDAGAYNPDEDIVPVCSDGVWCFVNSENQVKYLPSEKYTWLGTYNSGLAPFCCDGIYGYTDLEYEEKSEKYDYAGSFNEGTAAVMRDGKWALVNSSLELLTGFDFDEIEVDRYGFCMHGGTARAVRNGTEIYLDASGKECGYRTVYSCGLAPVSFGETEGYENEAGDIVIEAFFDEVTDFTENGRALVKEDDYWKIITLDIYE